MNMHSPTALVALHPIPWPSSWDTYERAHQFHDKGEWKNGVVYVGVEANRTKRLYSASGLPEEEVCPMGQLIDIYV
ncbi:MAG: hypothetical protein JRI90_02475 [Deltaproteobacteria bacterium]|nr:hypothetical protein [Deltaproteobacteria bacterium]